MNDFSKKESKGMNQKRKRREKVERELKRRTKSNQSRCHHFFNQIVEQLKKQFSPLFYGHLQTWVSLLSGFKGVRYWKRREGEEEKD